MLDETDLEAMVEDTLGHYRGVVDDDTFEEMRRMLFLTFEAHPAMSATAIAAFPAKNAERSGERGEDEDDEGDEKRSAGGEGA